MVNIYPDAYAMVQQGVSRSIILQPASYGLFKGLKTVLLTSSELHKGLSSWAEDNNINVIHLGAQTYTGSSNSASGITEELVKQGLEIILNVENHPILVMCSSGQETGCIFGCLRKLQGWNFNSIVAEYRGLSDNKSKYAVELFIDLFDLDLVNIPINVPNWFNKRHSS